MRLSRARGVPREDTEERGRRRGPPASADPDLTALPEPDPHGGAIPSSLTIAHERGLAEWNATQRRAPATARPGGDVT